MASNKPDRITTPPGVAVFPHLHRPDTKFSKEGIFKTDLRFTGEAAETMVEILDPLADAAYADALENYIERSLKKIKGRPSKKARKKFADEAPEVVNRYVPYEYELDEDGEPTDSILITFKMKASGTRNDGTRWTMEPAIFDAQGELVAPGLKIGGGSKLRVSFTPNTFDMGQADGSVLAGANCRLEAVQVLELKTWATRKDAGSFGFTADDGGFSAEDVDDSVFAEDQPFDDGEDDDGLPWDEGDDEDDSDF